MFTIAILEDEPIHAQRLSEIIENWCAKENNPTIEAVTNVFNNGYKLLSKIKDSNRQYDIIFLDIELKQEENGMEIAQSLRKAQYENMIVFTTNHEAYTRDGYVVDAFRYLMKPLDENDVITCLDAALKNHAGQYLHYSFRDIHYKIPLDSILYISSQGHYITIHSKDGEEYTDKRSLVNILSVLPNNFFRCHRSYVVNIDYVYSLNGTKASMGDGAKLDIAKRYLPIIRNAITKNAAKY